MASKAAIDFGFLNPGNWLSAGASVYSGISALTSARENASLMEEQGALTRDDYFRQASLIRDEGQRTRAKQTMEYISAGVEAIGTPQLLAKETLKKSEAKAKSYETTGRNYQNLYGRKAKIIRNEGQAALVSGILQGAATLI